ncbi:hypothetical protein B0T21DRAFT_411933 [Apiosordaria backusii]|uniref:Uncharacterized protein n=1 Tax=Apiosordaria backusii TaxID=314023 RepID=A0AA40ECW9_9PEZI|nr:hypothetical protein B0T21DRAFT_411933 [Apiosordaria backusii]
MTWGAYWSPLLNRGGLFIERALTCTDHISTPEDFRISIFCGCSLADDVIEGCGRSTIAITRYRSDANVDGDCISLAWLMEISLASSNTEGTAILEGITQVGQEVTEIFTSRNIPVEKLPKDKLIVDLYSDGESVIVIVEQTKMKMANHKSTTGRQFKFQANAGLAKHLSFKIIK